MCIELNPTPRQTVALLQYNRDTRIDRLKMFRSVSVVGIPETSIKEIKPLLLFAGCRARERENTSEKRRVRKKMTNARDAKLRPADNGC